MVNLRGFAADMRAQGIHVGLNGRCCVDGEPWPCGHERAARLGAAEAQASLFDVRAVPAEAHPVLPRNPTDTQAATAAAVAPKLNRLQEAVLDAIEAEPATDDELVERLGRGPNTVRPRRVELVRLGLVEDSGDRRPSAYGRPAIVWRTTR